MQRDAIRKGKKNDNERTKERVEWEDIRFALQLTDLHLIQMYLLTE